MSDQLTGLNQLSPERRRLLALRALRLREEQSGKTSEKSIPRLVREEGLNFFQPSSAQERLWFLDRLIPDSTAYNLCTPLRVRGVFVIATLEASLNEMLRRHEILRTNLLTKDGKPIQVVGPAGKVNLKKVDLSYLPEVEREGRASLLVAEEAGRPFNLAQDPLLRAMLLRIAEQESILVFTTHHVAFDEWSAGVFIKELAALYEAFCKDQPSPLPDAPIQYADYAAWQRQWLQSEAFQTQLSYWKQQLAGTVPVLELPTDRPRSINQKSRAAKQVWTCPKALSDSLRALSRQEGVTPFILLLTAFKVLLYRYTGQEDVVVGSPIANRQRRELEEMLGFFVNILVLRSNLSGDLTFREALSRVREVVLKAYANQDVPFDKLIQELQPERDPSRGQPLFSIFFSLQNALVRETTQIEGLEISSFPIKSDEETFEDLNFLVTDKETGIGFLVEYNADLFEAETIARMLGHYQVLLESIVVDPDQLLTSLPLLPAAERHQLLNQWNETHAAYDREICLHELFERQVQLTPDVTAVVLEDQELTYKELNCKANQLARYLRTLGAGPETVVGICVQRSLEMVVAVLGALKAGCAYVMLDSTYPRDRLTLMLQDAGVRLLLSQQALREQIPTQDTRVIYLDTDWTTISKENDENFASGAVAENLAYVIYTSGSTGRPKAIGLPHRALTNMLAWHFSTLFTGTRTIQFASLSFDVSIHEILSTCCSGGTLFLIREELRKNMAELVAFVKDHRIEVLNLPTVMLPQLADVVGEQAESLASLDHLLIAGEQATLTPPILRFFDQLPGCSMHNIYGPSETHAATCFTARHPPEKWPRLPPLGRPISNTQIYILDERMQPVPVGTTGELYISGICLSRGYLNRPDLTADKYIPNPFATEPGRRLYRTGDLGRYLADGTIKYLGRADFQVKIRGYRIELGEIEIVLGQHPAVRDVAVIVREDVPGEKRLAAYVVLNQQTSSPRELRSFVQDKLPDYMVPASFSILKSFPHLPNGKVNRRALPAPDSTRPELDTDYVAPRSDAEQVLADIWAQVLKLERVGVNDNFIELGGDSILSFQVVSRAREAGLVLTLKQFYDHPTVARLAALVQTSQTTADAPSASSILANSSAPQSNTRAQDSVDYSYPLSSMQQGMLFHCLYDPARGNYLEVVSFAAPTSLDANLFKLAWQQLIQRHAVLRTACRWEGGDLAQVVHREVEVPLEIYDCRHLSRLEQEERVTAFIHDEQVRDFDLEHAPLMRLSLLRLDEHVYQFVWSYSHIILDGWSQALLLNEVEQIYQALIGGKDVPLHRDDRYREYIEWLGQQDIPAAKDYWSRILADFTAPTTLALSGSQHTVSTLPVSAVANLRLSPETTAALLLFARRHRLTLNTLVQGAWALTLSRYSGERDVVFGSVVSGRAPQLAGSGEMVGMFINTLPVRVKVAGETMLVDWLLALQADHAEGRQYEYSPLIEVQKWSSVERGAPLFECALVLENFPRSSESEWRFTGWSLQQTGYPLHAAVRIDEELTITLTYRTSHFSAADIGSMLSYFETVMACFPLHANETVAGIPLLTKDDEQQLAAAASGAVVAFELDHCLHHYFEAQVRRTPEAVAVVFEGEQQTYAELNRNANKLAHALVAHGVGPDVLVAFLAERNITFLTVLLAIFKAGGAYLPLDPFNPIQSLAEVVKQSRVSLVLQSAALAPLNEDALENFSLEKLPRVLTIEELWPQSGSEENLPSRSVPENLAYVIYTSGSTGKPKGVMIEQRGMLNHLYAKILDLQLTGADTIAQTASQCFDISVWQFFAALLVGGRTHILSTEVVRDPARLLSEVASNRVSILETVPSLLQMILDSSTAEGPVRPELLSLRWLIPTGEALPPELCRRWLKLYPLVPLLNAYGPTECSDDVSHYPIHQPPDESWANMPIGRPLANMRLHVLDRWLQPTPLGVTGELYVAGIGVGRGYLHDPQITAEVFVPDPFAVTEGGSRLYKTGDQVRLLADGNIEFLGRVDLQVKVHGYRIELGSIESALLRHPGVREAVALVREETPGDKRLVAYVVAQPGHVLEPSELYDYSAEQLPPYMIPSTFVLLAALPLNANGKIDRRRLPAVSHLKVESNGSLDSPHNEVEQVLAGIWAEVLGLRNIGIHENFFRLGGDSILSIQVVAKANQAKLGLTPTQLFQHPTIAELASIAGTAPVVNWEEQTEIVSAPLTPIQHWFFEQQMAAPHHWNQSQIFQVPASLDPVLLERAVESLLAHHDALRLRFFKSDGDWYLRTEDGDHGSIFTYEDLSALSEDFHAEAIESVATTLQTSLNLTHGPLARIALFNTGSGRPSRLLIIVHHLVIDGVSWRILIEDLQNSYQQLSRGEAVSLPPRTTSFKQWALRLAEYARSEELQRELDYWLTADQKSVAPLPLDNPVGINSLDSIGVVSSALSEEETQRLLYDVPAAYHSHINDILLAALLLTINKWTGAHSLRIQMEGHGREDIIPVVDTSRTIGWFTSLYPVLLAVEDVSDPGALLKSVKEQLRRIPNKGIGYGLLRYLSKNGEAAELLASSPQPQLTFNYLGQFDQVLRESSLFAPAHESVGLHHDRQGKRSSLLDVTALVSGRRLRVSWAFSENLHHSATIEKRSQDFLESLRSLIAHCLSPAAGGYTPSDFPRSGLDQSSLDLLIANSKDGVEDIYRLSPVQRGILFQIQYEPESGAYALQFTGRLRGQLDVAAFTTAFQQVVSRHSILRTSFHWEELDDPVQVVHQRAQLPTVKQDWRGLTEPEQQARLADYLRADRLQGFDLNAAPLMRLTLLQLDEEVHQIVWSWHHLILDGWSFSLLMKEIVALYNSRNQHQEVQLKRPRPYRDYIEWLEKQDSAQAEAFWRRTLGDLTTPTRVAQETNPFIPSHAPDGVREIKLSRETTEAMSQLAHRHQLTLNTLVQGAWALLLSRYSGEREVVFGNVVSGRAVNLDGVEQMIGLFVNTLPVRVGINGGQLILEWLESIQAEQAEARQYEHSALVEVQRCSGLPHGVPLLESLFSFGNLGARHQAEPMHGASLEMEDARAEHRTPYPLHLSAEPGERFSFRLDYQTQSFNEGLITRMLQHLEELIEGLVSNPSRRLAELSLTSEMEQPMTLGNLNELEIEMSEQG